MPFSAQNFGFATTRGVVDTVPRASMYRYAGGRTSYILHTVRIVHIQSRCRKADGIVCSKIQRFVVLLRELCVPPRKDRIVHVTSRQKTDGVVTITELRPDVCCSCGGEVGCVGTKTDCTCSTFMLVPYLVGVQIVSSRPAMVYHTSIHSYIR